MNHGIVWAGFFGAWLLVAGPLYQGALELREEEVDREEIEATKTRVARPQPPSPWWWLFPPAMYLIRSRQSRRFRDDVIAQLSPLQREQFTRFMNKAAGWFTVAAGGTLLAADQTWRVVEQYGWPVWLFWIILAVMLGGCVVNMAVRMIRDEQANAASRQADDAAPAG